MCTDFLITATDNTYVNGRSMEFGTNLKSQLMAHAPGEKFQSHAPWDRLGLSWTVKYGYVGMTVFGTSNMVDGMNTQGLSIGSLWLPGSSYPAVSQANQAVALIDFPSWVLGNCANVGEVQTAIESQTVQAWEGNLLDKLLPLHFPVHDAQGNSIVVEFWDKQAKVYTNPVAVLTNDPPFPFQLANLGNYAGLTPWDAQPVTFGQQKFKPSGHGSGMMGLPGDSLPTSRFIRAAYLKEYAQPPTNAATACNLAFHILNDVDIPLGTSRSKNLVGHQEDDYTQWTVVKDLTNKILYTRFYDNMLVYSVNLKTLDFSSAAGKQFPVPSSPTSIDLTQQMNS